MDYKEEYQNALERAKKGLPIDEVFPELKESEDERIRKELVEYFSRTGCNFIRGIPIERIMAYLEKRKERQPSEWSEEDEKCIKDIINCLEYLEREDTERQYNGDRNVKPERYEGMIAKLSSLRPSWKPSEEQVYSLGTVVKGYDNCTVGSVGYNLKELYEDLKKL